MKRYHGQPSTPTFPPDVKPPKPADVRDAWRRRVCSDPTLGARALRVALALLNFANASGYTSVGVDRLAEEMDADRRTVQRGLAALAAAGHLERENGAGVRGRGGWTAGTRLKGAAKPGSEGAANLDQRGGQAGIKGAATAAAQTLLTHITPAADAPGLGAGSATAENGDTGSSIATAGAGSSSTAPLVTSGGEVLGMLGDLATSRRSEPRPVREAVLSALRSKLGLPAQRQVSSNENLPAAGTWGGYGRRVPNAK